MDPSHLKPDEIQIEFELRKIPVNDPQNFQKLQALLEAESQGTQEKPTKMTTKAGRKPDMEIQSCRVKLESLRDQIVHLEAVQPTEVEKDMICIQSRLLHVQRRLELALGSPTYESAARRSLQSCNELLRSLNKHLKQNESLNSSIDSAKLVEIEQIQQELELIIPEDSNDASGDGESQNFPSSVVPENEVNRKDVSEKIIVKPLSIPSSSQALDQNKLMFSMMHQLNQMSDQLAKIDKRQNEFQAYLHAHPTPLREPKVSGPPPNITTVGANLINPTFPTPVSFQNPPPNMNPLYSNVYPSTSMGQVPTFVPNLWEGQQQNINHPRANHLVPSLVSGRSERQSLSRSGLSYSGSPMGINVDMFFFQLETVSSALQLTPEILMSEMHTVLKDVALQWFWTYRKLNPRASWEELKYNFIERFQDRRSNFEIRRIIDNRKQQANESFLDFYHHVWSLTLQSRTPYSDEELIQILMNNMKPVLQFHLTDRQFSTINSLIKSCTAWEETLKRQKMQMDFVPFHRRNVNELSVRWPEERNLMDSSCEEVRPEYSVGVYQPSPVTAATSLSHDHVNSVTVKPSNPSGSGYYAICFNCSDIGHLSRNCPMPPNKQSGLFCYKCGQKDTITARCTRCLGNSNRGQWSPGNQRSPRISFPRSTQEDVATNTDQELTGRTLTHTNQSKP